MNLVKRILLTALAFVVGITLMLATPFAFAYVFWTSEEDEQ